jgi:adenine-specific DNA-methyltransferase
LRSFLERELHFYLKNEVLLVDEVLDGGVARAEAWFQLSRAVLAVGRRIIGFVAQIEDFQKTLFEKRKFILDTQYCVACGSIPAELHGDIAENDGQWQEWKDLYHLDEEQRDLFSAGAKTKTARRIDFLKGHPGLVVDTKHFEQSFVDRLLGSFEDLALATDGVVIHGENFQALNLLSEQLRGKVRCVYIDPPYNSKTTEILYKNTYKHSSWLSLMQDRLVLSRGLTGSAGVHVVAIDENESERLGLLLGSLFPEHEQTAVSIVHNPRGIQGDNFSYSHEYAYFVYPAEVGAISPKVVPKTDWEYQNLRNWGGESLRTDGKTCFYPIIVKGDKIVDIGEVPADDFHPKGQNVRRRDGTVEVWPIDRNNVERKWRYARGSLRTVLHAARVKQDGEKIEIELARSVEMRKTVWEGSQYDASVYGTQLLSNLVPDAFSFPKSLYTVAECLQASGCNDGETVVDYFAGSGTTGHAAIHLNRQDGGRRRFVLVEMGQYFDTVLLPRIKKIMYAPEWKEGKPKRPATKEETARGPQVVKYLTLESYDDSLANITFDEAAGQPALQFDDYLISYMLKWETAASNTFLNIERIADPFSYRLRVVRDGQAIERAVDLPETFAAVLGLRTRTRRVLDDAGRRYVVERGTIDHREVAVIWRSTTDWSKADFERDRKFVEGHKLTDRADDVFVNADSTIPGAKSLDPLFKARMFAPLSANEAT